MLPGLGGRTQLLLLFLCYYYCHYCESANNNTNVTTFSVLDNEEEDKLLDYRSTPPAENSFRRPNNRLETFPLNVWYMGLAVVIAVIVLFLINLVLSKDLFACNCDCGGLKEKDTIPCYLCDKRVSMGQWNDGSHRRSCANKKRAALERMPRPLEVNCPNCRQVLRLWPQNLGAGFHCDNTECRSPRDEMVNSGYNRLNCFTCDYDICMACANRVVCLKQNIKPSVSNTGLAARNWLIHMNPMVQRSFDSSSSSKTKKGGGNRHQSVAKSGVMNAVLALGSTGAVPLRKSQSIRRNRSTLQQMHTDRTGMMPRRSKSARNLPSRAHPYTLSSRRQPNTNKRTSQPDMMGREEDFSNVVRYQRPPLAKALSVDCQDQYRPIMTKVAVEVERSRRRSSGLLLRVPTQEQNDGDDEEDEEEEEEIMYSAADTTHQDTSRLHLVKSNLRKVSECSRE